MRCLAVIKSISSKVSHQSSKWRLAPSFLLLLLHPLVLISCSYRFGDVGTLKEEYSTLYIPCVTGDQEGYLTDDLIREAARAGWVYSPSYGELTLCVSLCDTYHSNIGYQYDRDNEGVRTKRIVPNEGRTYLSADVSVIENGTGATVLGPICIGTDVAYDFDPLSTDTSLSVFSIGQYVNHDEAIETARRPLYRQLARKIIDYLTLTWSNE